MRIRRQHQPPAVFSWMGSVFLRVTGWRVEGTPPDVPKYVLIIAPHTSHWDAAVWMALLLHLRLPAHWLAKDSIFIGPWGWLLRRLGGIPIRRDGSEDVVAQAVRVFESRSRFILGLAPEGTRARRESWRSGFYRIAEGTGVPIVPCYADYGERVARIGAPLVPSGAVAGDMEVLRRFYAPAAAKIPERQTPVRLREEGERTPE